MLLLILCHVCIRSFPLYALDHFHYTVHCTLGWFFSRWVSSPDTQPFILCIHIDIPLTHTLYSFILPPHHHSYAVCGPLYPSYIHTCHHSSHFHIFHQSINSLQYYIFLIFSFCIVSTLQNPHLLLTENTLEDQLSTCHQDIKNPCYTLRSSTLSLGMEEKEYYPCILCES